MVPRSTPVGEVPPPLSVFYTGLIRRRRGRWKFSSPWHRKNAPYSRFFSAAIAILGVDLIPGCARNGGSPPLAPRGRGGGPRAFFFIDFFLTALMIFLFFGPGRGERPKTPKTRKVKMSRKRVFLVFLKVQGPRFSCKPNIAFFMGYPLYRGGGRVEHNQKMLFVILYFTLTFC